MLDGLRVVLCRTKFSENVGAAARACLNMGCPELALAAPRRFDPAKAMHMATTHARGLVDAIAVHQDLAAAVGDCALVVGTTARTGGWRKTVMAPRTAAERIWESLERGQRVALVFGPEDTGLSNEETQRCGHLVNIPTAPGLSSLNVAQAVLLILYECLMARAGRTERAAQGRQGGEPAATHAEQEALFAALREALLAIDFLPADNTDYWMLPLRRFFARRPLSRAERNTLMGVCRQASWAGREAKRRR